MNEVWDLSPIYPGFDSPEYQGDLKKLEDVVSRLDAFAKSDKAPTAAFLREALTLEEEFTLLVNKLVEYADLRQAANTLDTEAGSALGKAMGLYSSAA